MAVLYDHVLVHPRRQHLSLPNRSAIAVMMVNNVGHVFSSFLHIPRKIICLRDPSPSPKETTFSSQSIMSFRPASQLSDYEMPEEGEHKAPLPSPVASVCRITGPIIAHNQLDIALSRTSINLDDPVEEVHIPDSPRPPTHLSLVIPSRSPSPDIDVSANEESPKTPSSAETVVQSLSPPPDHYRRRPDSPKSMTSRPAHRTHQSITSLQSIFSDVSFETSSPSPPTTSDAVGCSPISPPLHPIASLEDSMSHDLSGDPR